jgi:hypothetical protein
MTDIVERLRAWVYTDSQYATAREAADAIERLRAEIARLSELAVDRRREIEMLCKVFWQNNLTDEERAALSFAADAYALNDDDHDCWRIANTLRGLLSRTGTNSRQTSDNAAECTDQ